MNPAPTALHFDPYALRARANCGGGFLTQQDVAALAGHSVSRLWPLLVRCHGGRFVAPAQDVAHFIELIERAPGGDFVRDVSFPAERT